MRFAKIASVVSCVVLGHGVPPCFAGEPGPLFEMQDLFESVRIPNITVATNGTVLAFAKSGRLLRRSEDGGKTWSASQEVGSDSGGSAIVDTGTTAKPRCSAVSSQRSIASIVSS